MKKSLVALAAFSAMSAFADVDVSGGIKMYGTLDQALMKQSWVGSTVSSGIVGNTMVTDRTNTGLFAAGATSRLGVKGSRDLGDGIKGQVQIEIELVPDSNSDQGGLLPTKNRGTFVGLEKSGVGFIRLGTQETTAYETFAMDVNGRVEYKPQVWRYTAAKGQQDRAGNSIKLQSADFEGFTASMMLARGDTNSSLASPDATDFTSYGLKYHKDALQVAFVYDTLKNTKNEYRLPGQVSDGLDTYSDSYAAKDANKGQKVQIAAAGDIVRQIAAASYTFGDFKVNYIYADARTAGLGNIKTNTLGARYTYDKFAVAYSIGQGKVNSDKTQNVGDVTDNTMGAYYNFDKSTSVYVLASVATYSAVNTLKTNSTTSSAIGVQYKF